MKLKNFILGHKVISIVIACAVVLLAGGGTVGGVMLHNHLQSILPADASFKGVSLSKMDVEQVTAAIENVLNQKIASSDLTFAYQEQDHTLSASDYGFRFDPAEVFEQAKKFDFKNGGELEVPIQYDEEKLSSYFETLESEVKSAPTPDSYRIVESNLIATPGKEGLTFNKETAAQDIVKAAQSLSFDEPVAAVEEPVSDDTMKIDFDAIYGEVKKEMQNATSAVNSEGVMVYTDPVSGVDFDLEAAKAMLETEQEEYVVPLKITPPEITVEQLKQQHNAANCPDLLSEYMTKFSAGDANRNFNIARAAAKIDGTVLQPGEAFSFHGVVKGTGKAQGYKESTVYSPKGIEKGYGGGVCQVSTTLYLAATYANMDITARRNHSYTVTYVPHGYDAAVSDGGQDLKFRNNRKYPIKIKAIVTGSTITMQLYGTKLAEEDYKVTLNSQTVETRPVEEKIEQNAALAPNQQNVISKGQPGYLVYTYKTVTLNGVQVSSTKITSSYKMLPKVIEVGPTQEAPPSEETPAPSEPPANTLPEDTTTGTEPT